ncbi:DNA alkylation repair protein, partial [Akkermansiaceae bacterium]|nr:DNA alkylation repair protein [Akkermansiaceae bacterium]
MTVGEVMAELESLGNEQTKKTLLRHGAVEPLFGVKIGDLKGLRKELKNDHDIALALYGTGNSDAMYLAGLIADSEKVTEEELDRWVNEAT